VVSRFGYDKHRGHIVEKEIEDDERRGKCIHGCP